MLLRLFIALMVLAPALHATRVKDMSFVSGGRSNQLIGYGIVVGLAGDGDSNAVTTLRSVANILQRNGLTVDPTQIKAKNSAAVMITADIPPFL
jgi:flagellar P-ring protein precursor FlgI